MTSHTWFNEIAITKLRVLNLRDFQTSNLKPETSNLKPETEPETETK